MLNHIYKVVWSKTKHCYVVVSEIAKRTGKNKVKSMVTAQGGVAVAALLVASVIAGGSVGASAVLGEPLPTSDFWVEDSTGTKIPQGVVVAEGKQNSNGEYNTAIAIGAFETNPKQKDSADSRVTTRSYGQGAIALGSGAWAGAVENGTTTVYFATKDSSGAVTKSAQDIKTARIDTSARSNIAIGDTSTSFGDSAIAFGRGAESIGEHTFAAGMQAKAKDKKSTAVGVAAHTTRESAVALGRAAGSHGISGVAIGRNATVTGSQGIAIGGSLTGAGAGASAADAAAANADGSIALGAGAKVGTAAVTGKASYDGSTDIYTGDANAKDGIAIGTNSSVTAKSGVALGLDAKVSKENGVALGKGSVADKDKGQAGYNVAANGARQINYNNLKDEVLTSTLAGVSVGSTGNTRQIHHVAAGTNDDDAVNVAQLRNVSLITEGNTGRADVLLHTGGLKVQGGTDSWVKSEAKQDGESSIIELDLTDDAKSIINNKIGDNNFRLGGDGSTVTNNQALSQSGGLQFNIVGASTTPAGSTTPVSYITTKASGSQVDIDLSDDAKAKLEKQASVESTDSRIVVDSSGTNETGGVKYKLSFNGTGGGTTSTEKVKAAANDATNNFTNLAKVTPASGATGYGDANQEYSVSVSKTDVQDAAKEAVKVSGTAPIKVELDDKTAAGVNNYKVSFDGAKAAESIPLTYKATNGSTISTAQKVMLSDGLNFTGGTYTTASVGANGVVTFDVNTGTFSKVTDGKPGTPGKDGIATVGDVTNIINNTYWNATSAKTTNGENTGATVTPVKASDTVTFEADKNMKIVQNGKKFTFSTKDDVTFNSTTSNTITVPNATTGAPAGTSAVTIDGTGIHAGDKKITNVAPGEISNTSKDAINGSQLYTVQEEAKKHTTVSVNNGNGTTPDGATPVGKGNLTIEKTTNAEGGHHFDVKLNDKITLGGTDTTAPNKKVVLDGTTGTGNIGGITFNGNNTGSTVVYDPATKTTSVGTGNTITGLDNKYFDPTNITSGQAATEDQLKQVNTDLTDKIANHHWVVSSDKTTGAATPTAFRNEVKNKNEVKFVGTGAATVSGETDAKTGVNTITVHVDPVTAAGDLKYTANSDTNKKSVSLDNGLNFVDGNFTKASVDTNGKVQYDVTLSQGKIDNGKAGIAGTNGKDGKDGIATIGQVVNLINNTGWKANAKADGGTLDPAGATATVVKPGDTVNYAAGKNLTVKQTLGTDEQTYTYSLNSEINLDKVVVGEKGTPGAPGKDGVIGLNGKDGQSAEMIVKKGQNGVDGKDGNNGTDGITRIVYKDENGKDHEVATMRDGMKYYGDAITGTDVIKKKLNEQVNVIGGITDKSLLADVANVGVISDGTNNLTIRLAKKLTSIESVGVDADNNISFAGDKGGVTIKGGDVNVSGNKITNVKDGEDPTDAVNVSQLTKVANEAKKHTTVSVNDGNGGTAAVPGTGGAPGTPAVARENDGANGSGNLTIKETTNAEGGFHFDVKLNNKVTLGSDADKKVVIDGTTGQITAGDKATINGNAGTANIGGITFNGNNSGKANTDATTGNANTITGLGNTTWDPTKYVTGQAATEDQLKSVDDKITNYGWKVSSNKLTSDVNNATKSFSNDVKNTNEVKFVGTGAATVSGETDATTGVNTITVHVDPVTAAGDLKYTANSDTNKKSVSLDNGLNFVDGNFTKASVDTNGKVQYDVTLSQGKIDNGKAGIAGTNGKDGKDGIATIGEVVNLINNTGWKANAKANGGTLDGTATATVVKAGDTVNYAAGKNLTVKQTVGTDEQTYTYSLNSEINLDKVVVGEKGTPGAPGKDGVIGLNGKDGQSAEMIVKKGQNGVDGKDGNNGTDGITRIVYKDENGKDHEVATMRDGLKFAGDDGQTDTTKVIAKKLNERLDIVGGADKTKLTDNNIGVNYDGGKLKVQLAKEVTGLTKVEVTDGDGNTSVTTPAGTTVTNKAGDTTVYGPNGITITPVTPAGATTPVKPIVITGDNISMGDRVIHDVAPGVKGTDAVNVDQLNNAKTAVTWKLTTDLADGGTRIGNAATTEAVANETVTFKAGKNLSIEQDAKTITYSLQKDLKDLTSVTVGKDGKDGVDGKIGVNGKDGSSVVINGKDGSIGLNGKDGANGVTIRGENGTKGLDGNDGKDGESKTRIVYEKPNGDKEEVATLNDGMKYYGDAITGTNVIKKKLNEQVNVIGGITDKSLLADVANVGVISDGTNNLTIRLAKKLTSIESVGVDADNNISFAGNKGGVTIQGGDVNVSGNKITNLAPGVKGTDAVNVDQLNKAVGATKTTVSVNDGNGGTATSPGVLDGANGAGNLKITQSTNSDGGLHFDVKLNDKVTLGTDADKKVVIDGTTGIIKAGDKVTIDGNKGNATIGGVTINGNKAGDIVNADGTVGKGNTITGLDNKVFDPDKITSGQAATEDQLKQVNTDLGDKITNTNNRIDNLAWKVNTGAVDGGKAVGSAVADVKDQTEVKFQAGKNLQVDQAGTTITYSLQKDLKDLTSVVVGKDGKNGVDGIIGVNGKDGSSVVINGKDGSIGLNGKDGANGVTIRGENGTKGLDGNDGKDGESKTRIVYEKPDGNKEEVATLNDGLRFKGDNAPIIDKKLNSTMEIVGGADATKLSDNNIGVNANNGKLEVKLAKDIQGISSVTFDGGNTTINNGGITITGGTGGSNVTLTKDGLDNGGNTITNVAPGKNGTDAVNVDQLNNAIGNITNVGVGEAHRAGAHAAALAALKPLQYDPLEPTQIMAGVGNYRSQTAAAIGIAHFTKEHTMFHAGVTLGNHHNMVNAGVTRKFGWSPEKKAVPDRYKAGPISSVYVMQDEVSALKESNEVLRRDNLDMKADNQELRKENQEIKAQLAMLMSKLGM